MPAFVSHQRGWGHNPTPMIHYRGADVREALDALRSEAGDPYEGIKLQFVNPVTGTPVYPTMNYAAQMLRPGEETQAKRETCNTFVVVLEGKGKTEIGGQTFDWEPNDIMVLPNFLWRRHINTGKSDAVLYTVSDSALMKNIGQYRAQGKDSDGRDHPARFLSRQTQMSELRLTGGALSLCEHGPMLSPEIVVRERTQRGPFQVVILASAQRPQKGREAGQSEPERDRHEIDQNVHGDRTIPCPAAAGHACRRPSKRSTSPAMR